MNAGEATMMTAHPSIVKCSAVDYRERFGLSFFTVRLE
jgi:hypothetical protein